VVEFAGKKDKRLREDLRQILLAARTILEDPLTALSVKAEARLIEETATNLLVDL
jgi:hypothetical protein